MAESDRGKVTVTNKAGQITIEKQWKDSDGRATTNHPENITYTVYQVKHEHDWGDWVTVDPPTEIKEGRVPSVDRRRRDGGFYGPRIGAGLGSWMAAL